MNFSDFYKITAKAVKDNSQVILASIGVSGTLTTAYLAAKASFKAANVLAGEPKANTKKEDIKVVWKFYIPTVISGATTIACIIGSTKIGLKKTAVAYSALTIAETGFREYKDKVVEQIGVKKEQTVRDSVAQDRVKKAPVGNVIVVGSGSVLCYEMYTGRYFQSDIESLRKAQNEVNAKMFREMEVTISEFYDMIGIPHTTSSSQFGWIADKLMELQFSTVLSDDGRPCIAFDYNYVKAI